MDTIIELKDDCSEKVHYNLPDYPVYITKGVLSQYPNYKAVSHWHNDVEFIVILSGHMLYNINGVIVHLNEGQGIFVNSRQLHYGFSDDCSECHFICILLHPLLLCSTQYIEQEYITPIISNSTFSHCILNKNLVWQNHIMDTIKKMYTYCDREFSILHIQSLFYELWRELYDHAPKDEKQSFKSYHQLSILKDMIGYIQKNYGEKITLNDISFAGKVCKSSCCAIFQKFLNQTPINYLTGYRLKKAIELMQNSDMTITEIAHSVGFSGASYYTETFRKYFNISPTEYRKNNKNHLIF